ncbi:MAG: MaoC family dehydratase [Clostridiales Family XIII bacterium]|jgi:3-hydroxybutyryl-CoA dehydratase|nr:MaoC family dehydratase [Clostridiales Family XIII bacterium]
MTYDELNIGDSATFEKTITETDVYGFAGIIGDFNPAHVNARKMAGTKFGQRIAHGMLSGSLFSTIFGTKLPGEGSIYLSQSLNFLAPVFFGDTILATVTVKEKLEKGRVKFECTAAKEDGTVVVSGEAVLLPPRE